MFPLIIIGGIVFYAFIHMAVRSQGASLNQKFHSLGDMRGRTMEDIIAVVGPPNSRSTVGNGRVICQWIQSGYHIALIFTDDICDGISHEFAA